MFIKKIILSVLGSSALISMGFAQSEQTLTTTQTVVDRPIIVTAVPAPKEVIDTPSGFINCFTIKEGWYQDVWLAEHRVCQYENSPSGVAWVEGYWACSKYNMDEKKCTTWDWKAARWEKTLSVY
ncbi:MAG: hypothetical protein H0W64_06365 [Gammaproteobacteria bacterium]|nr:hypothetical protein [Gammaproteobacteria bacterium]